MKMIKTNNIQLSSLSKFFYYPSLQKFQKALYVTVGPQALQAQIGCTNNRQPVFDKMTEVKFAATMSKVSAVEKGLGKNLIFCISLLLHASLP